MPNPAFRKVFRQLRRAALLSDGAGLNDAQLLECFLTDGDAAAFAALVRRHGPMVFGVCRRLLPQPQPSSAGRSSQAMPVLRTNKMPVRTLR